MLIEITYAQTRQASDLALVLQQFARQNVYKRGFTRPVKSDDAYMLAVVYREVGIHEQVAVVVSVR